MHVDKDGFELTSDGSHELSLFLDDEAVVIKAVPSRPILLQFGK